MHKQLIKNKAVPGIGKKICVGLKKNKLEQFNAFRANWDFIFFINLAEAGLWAYFFIQLGLVLTNFGQLRDYWATGQPDNSPALVYIKRAGTAFIVLGVAKLVSTLYAAFTIKSLGV